MFSITDVRIKKAEPIFGCDSHVLAYVNIALDGCFAVKDLRIILGKNGLFVSMPYRKVMDHCHQCNYKNALTANYCNHCGVKLAENRGEVRKDGHVSRYVDVAHPFTMECRKFIDVAVLDA